jgi:hypothetical protein
LSDPNAGAIHILRKSVPWVRLLSVVGFIFVGLFALLGLAAWRGMLNEHDSQHPIGAVIFCAVTMIMLLVPSLYLHQSVGRMSVFLAQGHTVQLEAVLETQRKFWQFAGGIALLWLICLAIGVIGIVAGL